MTSLQLARDERHLGRWWHAEDGRFRCELCPRRCLVSPGQRAFCFVRAADVDGIHLTTYGHSSGFCVDPIEKKPFAHFYPGTSVLSLGTAGCNLGCKYCQNWDMSKAREVDLLADLATPAEIADAAEDLACPSVAFTYNEPTIFAEYAIDIARECRRRGIHPVAVTNGYIQAQARAEFYAAMDAANIDLKGFTDDFYHDLCSGHLQPVLETIRYVVEQTNCWVELTTLLIPGYNDGDAEIDALTRWVKGLGRDVPLHFSAFHPDYRMLDVPSTPAETLTRARRIAMDNGVRYVYTGNVIDPEGASTWCPGCGTLLIERRGYWIGEYHLDRDGRCTGCGERVPGHFDLAAGTRAPVRGPVRVGEPLHAHR